MKYNLTSASEDAVQVWSLEYQDNVDFYNWIMLLPIAPDYLDNMLSEHLYSLDTLNDWAHEKEDKQVIDLIEKLYLLSPQIAYIRFINN